MHEEQGPDVLAFGQRDFSTTKLNKNSAGVSDDDITTLCYQRRFRLRPPGGFNGVADRSVYLMCLFLTLTEYCTFITAVPSL